MRIRKKLDRDQQTAEFKQKKVDVASIASEQEKLEQKLVNEGKMEMDTQDARGKPFENKLQRLQQSEGRRELRYPCGIRRARKLRN